MLKVVQLPAALFTLSALAITAVPFFSIQISDVQGQQDDSRLQKRIEELEAENRALRRIIQQIQNTLKSVPSVEAPADTKEGGLRLIVMPDDWGDSQLADIEKVALSASGPILSQLEDTDFQPIIIQRSKSGPITLYQRGPGNEYVVRLDSSDRAWAQLAFQFTHEFCHIICNYRNVDNPQMWFEETICECASLYSLRQMGVNWQTHPPYPNWKSYSAALAGYANDRIAAQQGKDDTLPGFYKKHLAELEKTSTNRELNNFVAVKLLPLFEKTSSGWRAIRYLNMGDASENQSFQTYLSKWHQRVPEKHKPFVLSIARAFEIEITNQQP